MGLADRDYLRTDRSAGGRGRAGGSLMHRLPAWSVTTWIIVINVAVFVLDRTFLPPTFAPTGITIVENEELAKRYAEIPKDRLVEGEPVRVGRNRFQTTQFVIADGGQPVPVVSTLQDRVPLLQRWLQFTTAQAIMYPSKTRGLEGFEFWRLLGYMFLHADATHLFFNMLGLYFFGAVVEHHLGRKRYLAFYLLCGIFGALLYMMLNLGGIAAGSFGWSIPGLLPNSPYAPLIGASAGVFGVIMAGAYLIPNEIVYLFFVLPMRLATLAYGLIVVAVATVLLNGSNAGGEAAHLGGAIAGAWFIRRPHQLHGFFDLLGRADPTSRSNRARKARRSGTLGEQAELDRLLAKVRERGLGGLTEAERRRLQEISRSL